MVNMLPWLRRLSSSLLALLLVCLPAVCQTSATPALDKAAVEAYIRHLFAWGPDIKVELGDAKPSGISGLSEVTLRASAGGQSVEQQYLVSQDGTRIIRGTVYDIRQNPFHEDLSKLTNLEGPSLGTPGAPVVLVLFTDFECPYCREQAVELRDNLLATYPKQVRLYVEDFPLEPIHPWAKAAAIAGRCIYRQNPDAYWRFFDWIFAQQEQIQPGNLRAKIMGFAQNSQIEALGLGRCIDSKDTEGEVNDAMALGKTLQVEATPTLFINGRRIASLVRWPRLKGIIDNELEYQKMAKNAGDQPCCVVSPPSPLPEK